jgi:hypothetical protein
VKMMKQIKKRGRPFLRLENTNIMVEEKFSDANQ